MDSSAVNKRIKSVIRPMLQDVGFTQFTSRTAWRYSPEKIDVVNFQSFNSYLANAVGCTTYSFSVNLGCSFAAIPRLESIKRKDGYFRPEEYECHFRRTLQKSIKQPQLKRKDIWYVDPAGENLELVTADAKNAIQDVGLDWFNRFSDLMEVLCTLLKDSETKESVFGFGANPSPMRDFMTGFTALSLGKIEIARERIKKALDSGRIQEFQPKMHATLAELEKK